MKFLSVVLGFICAELCAGAGLRMCMPAHPQQLFCRADYAVRVKVMSKVKEEVWSFSTEPSAKPTTTAASPTTKPARPSTASPTLPAESTTRTSAPLDVIEVQKDEKAGKGFAPAKLTPPIVKYQEVRVERILKGKDVIRKYSIAGKSDKKPTVKIYLNQAELKQKNVLIVGKVIEDKLWVSFCDWCAPWKSLTAEQKRGVKKVYGQNCDCKVMVAFDINSKYKSSQKGCYWVPDLSSRADPSQDCGFRHQHCFRNSRGYCEMTRKSYLKCINKRYP